MSAVRDAWNLCVRECGSRPDHQVAAARALRETAWDGIALDGRGYMAGLLALQAVYDGAEALVGYDWPTTLECFQTAAEHVRLLDDQDHQAVVYRWLDSVRFTLHLLLEAHCPNPSAPLEQGK